MNARFWLPLLIIVFIIANACQEKNKIPEKVVDCIENAGNNKKELKEVINHYQNQDNELKLEAAFFLIKNMPYNYSYYGSLLNKYDTIFHGMANRSRDKDLEILKRLKDQYGELKIDRLEVRSDLRQISSEYIINNIDKAFKAWNNKPWNDYVEFQSFCRNILPYRCTNEHLSYWRKKEMEKYDWLEDSLEDPTEVLEAYQYIYDSTKASFRGGFQNWPFSISYDNYQLGRKGICDDEANMYVYALRANGIPAVIDYVPHWGNARKGHRWHSIIGPDGDAYTVFQEDSVPRKFQQISVLPINAPGRKYFPDHIKTYDSKKVPKVYRKQFHKNENSLRAQSNKDEPIPENMDDFRQKDVTDQYLEVSDISLDIENPHQRDFAYLGIFTLEGWEPMGWGKVSKNNIAKFNDVGRGILYQPITIEKKGEHTPASNPFILHEDGSKQTIKLDTTQTQVLKLYRKYPLFNYILNYANYMYKGRFEGSNNPDFENAEVLHKIDSTPTIIQNIDIDPDKAYRYYRYVPHKERYGDIGVLKFFTNEGGQEKKIEGKPIGVENKKIFSKLNKGLSTALDGKYFTYYSIGEKTGGWVGIDAGKPVKASRIHYSPRNDTNYIMPGQEYELFYWNNEEWVSLGKKTGTKSGVLLYKNAPKNALFWLQNLDKGVEERPFTYENGAQHFW